MAGFSDEEAGWTRQRDLTRNPASRHPQLRENSSDQLMLRIGGGQMRRGSSGQSTRERIVVQLSRNYSGQQMLNAQMMESMDGQFREQRGDHINVERGDQRMGDHGDELIEEQGLPRRNSARENQQQRSRNSTSQLMREQGSQLTEDLADWGSSKTNTTNGADKDTWSSSGTSEILILNL